MTENTSRLSTALADRYQIERRLGEGGMATVYLAEDLKHKRKVALKVLRPELAAVLGGERFIQEITTTASLQHPHILPLFDSGEADSFLYYVMPFIDGETLRDKLDRETQLGIDEAVKIATEVADALDYAHRNGIIHRDIKPENILLHDGRPMVADFGIALAVSAAAGGRMTETGLSLGTPHYMSPEQATAEKELTNRADIYSLGSVLFEMLTGDPPHTASSAQAIVMKIVTDDARPVSELRKSVPPHVAAAVAKSLEKLAADRFATAAEFAEALKNPAFAFTSGATFAGRTPPTAPTAPTVPTTPMAVITVLAIAVAAWSWFVRPSPEAVRTPVTRFTIPVPEGISMHYNPKIAISPDGRTVVYLADDDVLYRRDLHDESPEVVTSNGQELLAPFISPDGRWIIGAVNGSVVPVAGGDLSLSNPGSIGRRMDFDLVLGNPDLASGLLIVPAGQTEGTVLTSAGSDGSEGDVWPQVVPGGRYLVYTIVAPGGLWNGSRVVVKDRETETTTTVAEDATYGRYVSTGHILYLTAAGTVEAVPFDLDGMRTSGNAFAVETGVRTAYWGGAGSFAVSEAGTFVFIRGSSWQNNIIQTINRDGSRTRTVAEPVTVERIELSPDGRFMTTYVASPNADVSILDLVDGTWRRLTFDPTTEDNPIFSHDGSHVFYRKLVSAQDHRVYSVAVDGLSDAVEILAGNAAEPMIPFSISPDGEWLLLVALNSNGIDAFNLSDGTQIEVSPDGFAPTFSADGRWIAYESSETTSSEIYVVGFPGLAGKRQVSLNGGARPQWAWDSGELFYLAADTLMVANTVVGDAFDVSTPRPLLTLDAPWGAYDVSPDGQEIVYPGVSPDAPAREIHVVLNWFEEVLSQSRAAGN